MITYRTAGDWGAGKGGNLTAAEVDENFWWLHEQIVGLGTGAAPAEIDNISVSGNQLTISLTDLREFGPFTIPRVAFLWRGEWASSTAYDQNDVITVAGDGLYLVLAAHTSPLTFDADHEVSAEAAYQVMFKFPVTSQVITESGTVLTLDLSYSGTYVRCTNAAGCDVTVPAEADVNFAIGAEIIFWQAGAGDVVLLPDAGVAIMGYDEFALQTNWIGSQIVLKKVGSDAWDVFGDLAYAPSSA